MKPKSRMVALTVAGALALPLTALAQGGGQGSLSADDFSQFDRDGDGTIDRNEWRQVRRQQMQQQRMQQSGQYQQGGQQARQDGRQAQAQQQGQNRWVVVTITPVEQRIMDEQRRESLFRAIDANADGVISAQEAGLNVQLMQAFNQLDRNGNAAIDRQEFTSVHVQDSGQQQAQSGQGQQSSASAGGSSSGGQGSASAGSSQPEQPGKSR